MGRGTLRMVLFGVCLLSGALGGASALPWEQSAWIGAGLGAMVFLGVYGLDRLSQRSPPQAVFGAMMGALVGLVGAVCMRGVVGADALPTMAALGVAVVMAYLGGIGGVRGMRALRGSASRSASGATVSPKVLDSSVVIDGRVADMVELGFVGGPIVVPQFVLAEIQSIADHADAIKRARGRRGLGVLERLQGMDGVEVKITDQDFPNIKDVDGKIVALGKATGATVITNDFNMAKVAELQGVRVLNINQLAEAVRPVFLPGEELEVLVQKEGKESGQGVGYLEDGTMVIVEGGVDKLGQRLRVTVTSLIQTSNGRLIFAREGAVEVEPVRRKKTWKRPSGPPPAPSDAARPLPPGGGLDDVRRQAG